MEYEAAKIWVDVGQFLITGAIGVYLWWERQSDSTRQRIDSLETDVDARLDNQGMRLSRVEAKVDQLPSHEDIGDLHARINDVARGMNTMSGEMSGIKTTLNLIHQHLLNGGAK